jgi:hypothetical protein
MEKLREVAKEQFLPIYLTLMSIIQSFALGYLLVSVLGYLLNSALDLEQSGLGHLLISVLEPEQFRERDQFLGLTWIQFLVIFLVIVLTSHEYVISILMIKYVVGLSDPFIPFLLGIAEFVMISLVFSKSLHMWLYSVTAFTVISLWAYENMIRKAGAESENKEVFRLLGFYPLITKGILTFIGVFTLTSGFTVHFANVPGIVQFALVGAVLVLLVVFACRTGLMWQRLTKVQSEPVPKFSA